MTDRTAVVLGFFLTLIAVSGTFFMFIGFSGGGEITVNLEQEETATTAPSTPTPKVVVRTITNQPATENDGEASDPSSNNDRATETVQPTTSPTRTDTMTATAVPTQPPTEPLTESPEKDSDGDGLSNEEERRIGTDPYDKDTDGDGLLDGWEVYGVTQKGCHVVDINEVADPLHKDIFIEIRMPEDERIPERVLEEYRNQLAQAPVSNPDNEEGINVHTIQNHRRSEQFWDGCRWGIYHFMYFYPESRGKGYSSASAGGSTQSYYLKTMKIQWNEEHWTAYTTLTHETVHNMAGELDEDIQEPGDKYHAFCDRPRDTGDNKYGDYGLMCSGTDEDDTKVHPEIWGEISRDGMLGLPDIDDWKIPD